MFFKNGIGDKLKYLNEVIPLVGISICIVIAIGVSADWSAQKLLQRKYSDSNIELGVHDSTFTCRRIPGYLLPLIFVASWGYLLELKFSFLYSIIIYDIVILSTEGYMKYKLKFRPFETFRLFDRK